jgi:hypothetical protein
MSAATKIPAAPMSEDEIARLVDSMCMTMRHDFGLEADPECPLDAGMTPAQRDGLRTSMRQLVHHHFFPLLATLRATSGPDRHDAISLASVALPKGVVIETLPMRVLMAQSASCTCMTKTPDFSYHDANCRYRVLSECAQVAGAVIKASTERSGK